MSDKKSSPPFVAVGLADGRVAVTGQTFGAQIVMRAYHGKYDPMTKLWVFADEAGAKSAIEEGERLLKMGN